MAGLAVIYIAPRNLDQIGALAPFGATIKLYTLFLLMTNRVIRYMVIVEFKLLGETQFQECNMFVNMWLIPTCAGDSLSRH